jgi:branched-chain amino acid transport system ATP-binding protein
MARVRRSTQARHLAADDVHAAFDGVVALDGVSGSLERGEILGLIGPNGAGKTTLINVLSGFVPVDRGEVILGNQRITKASAARRATLGIARTFQGVRLFRRLTVRENVEAAALAMGGGVRGARSVGAGVLAGLDLAERGDVVAGSLSYGEERRVGIARALATEPLFLLLDEPAAGLDEDETAELDGMLRRIRDEYGVGMLVVEHDMSLIMGLCDRIQVLAEGRTLAVGSAAAIRANADVRRAYLGIGEEPVGARG